ncbi:hemolysin III family protein [Shewanella waksmanii]|uniref:PAQR family membrane homeostasis protein TrhA n=1 Tax=Shewanella waksmanii TaxID=213783 RepID=UPI003736A184
MSKNHQAMTSVNPNIALLPYSAKEELANSISHGIGVVFGIIGLVLMLSKGLPYMTWGQLVGVSLYGGSFILLFLCSTLYHSATTPIWRQRWKLADHCAIYLLIAGTYTPMMMIELADTQATLILVAIWGLAIGGIIFKALFIHRFKKLSLALYLIMGWLCVTVMEELIQSMSELGFNLLLAGGVLYSLGVVFYVAKRIPFNHAIWHLFVLGGAISHFLCIYLTVI